MADFVEGVGPSDELRPLDYLLHRGEANPRTRAGIMAVELLDAAPDWNRFRTRIEDISRQVLRLRQKVVVPTLPTTAPRWVVDPDFDLDFHVRRMRVPEPGTLREVFDLAEVIQQSPMDVSRPLWTATLVEGLAAGRAAMLLQISHAITDGVGSIEMFAEMYDLERDTPARPISPQPIPQDLSRNDLMRQGINHLPVTLVSGVVGALSGVASGVGQAILRPASTVSGVVGYVLSGIRVLNQAAEPSPLLRQRSLATRTEAIEIRLSDLRAAAKAGGGSINDAYLAGLTGALYRYHKALGVSISTLPMSVPVNMRTKADKASGNRFIGVNLAAPLGTIDPAARMQKIRAQMIQRRDEPAVNIIGSLMPLMAVLPAPMLDVIVDSIVGSDVHASNIPSYPGDTYFAGAKVLRQYGIGQLSGVAMMVVLMSRGGFCTVTVRYDRASVKSEALFTRCLLEGFDEVLALAGDPAPHAVPTSLVARSADSPAGWVSSS
ncbi:wax ester/triacylglycerol synthase family O-acyltransferase [Mycobacterium uberis]|uniref:Diacylglycerol O-acyltransferase n=1 Tax=Mycobacterium uberis TaxID=2162698 RepID=A0A3E1HEV3_9MYCO|nr:wax ester/triacylglycerol synthase family O-acyltransferase [Mycobacterium uberis]RFD24981.1 wax ester/triacylglycerol synthase family O-acyltransferase [Mycobacterium uberis]